MAIVIYTYLYDSNPGSYTIYKGELENSTYGDSGYI